MEDRPVLERVHVARGIEPEDGDDTPVGRAKTLDALHCRGLAGAVRSDEADDLAGLLLERPSSTATVLP